MKNVITGIVAVCLLGGCATLSERIPASPESKIVIFTEKTSLARRDAFPLAMECLAETYNSAQTVIQYQDKEAGIIVVKAIQEIVWYSDFLHKKIILNLDYTLTVKIGEKTINFKFLARDVESTGNVTDAEMEIARKGFTNIKNEVMQKLDPSYISKSAKPAAGTTRTENGITIWTADPPEK